MGRTGTVERKTKETEIVASVDLEGSGTAVAKAVSGCQSSRGLVDDLERIRRHFLRNCRLHGPFSSNRLNRRLQFCQYGSSV